MFCVYCGNELPNEAKFCFQCGKEVYRQIEGENVVETLKEGIAKKTKMCSGREQRMVYVSGYGVYFLKSDGVWFYSEEEKRIKVYEMPPMEELFGLVYYQDFLFFWGLSFLDGYCLYKMDCDLNAYECVHTNESSLFNSISRTGNPRVIAKDEYYYYVRENQLIRFSLVNYKLEFYDLFDIRKSPLPNDWENICDFLVLNEEDVNYGNRFGDFNIVGNIGIVSIDSMAGCCTSFSLTNPSDFEFLPYESINTYKMLTTIGEDDTKLFSWFNDFRCLTIDEEGKCLSNTKLFNEDKALEYRLSHLEWFVSNNAIYVLGSENALIYKREGQQILLRISEPFGGVLGVKDFVDVPSQCVTYILTNESLFRFSYNNDIRFAMEEGTMFEYVIAEW